MSFSVNGTQLGFVSKSLLFDIYPSLSNVIISPKLWLWGEAFLGDNTTLGKSSPVQTIAGGTNWKQVSCGNLSTAAIKSDGTLWTWGSNSNGQLGNNTITALSKSSPVQTITGGTNWKQVASNPSTVADQRVFGIKTDGTLWGWGSNYLGSLGDNTLTNRSSPVQSITGGTNWKQVATGDYNTAAIKTDGTLWTWGANTKGEIGDNTITSRSSPVQTITGGTNWKQVSCGSSYMTAIKSDGTLWTWGSNLSGQLGDNTTASKSSPVQTIAGGTNWKQVSAGMQFVAAIKTDGTLWTWGDNYYGTLGNNTNVNSSSPVQTIAGGTNWKQVSAGASVTGAIKTDGTLWVWGDNYYNGTLGTNNNVNSSSPIQTVAGGTNWKQVSCGSTHVAAIAEDDPFL